MKITCFCFYQQNKGSESKVKFRQASICFKWVLQASPIVYATKIKESITPQKLALRTFGELLKVFSTKINLLYLLHSMTTSFYLLHFIKKNCLLKTFLRTLILITRASVFCNSHMVKMVITSLDSSLESGREPELSYLLAKLVN